MPDANQQQPYISHDSEKVVHDVSTLYFPQRHDEQQQWE
jgi:hypothetical protein